MAKILCHHYRDKGWDLPYVVSFFACTLIYPHLNETSARNTQLAFRVPNFLVILALSRRIITTKVIMSVELSNVGSVPKFDLSILILPSKYI
jgi:hypothetical protein